MLNLYYIPYKLGLYFQCGIAKTRGVAGQPRRVQPMKIIERDYKKELA